MAVRRAWLQGPGRLSLHSLRHGFASLLIANGLDVVFVSRRILEGADLVKLLAHAGIYRPLFELLAFTGLRIGEALGLRWGDVDFEAGVLHVRQQLGRDRLPRKLKTPAGRREVILCAPVTELLSALRGTDALGVEELIFRTTTGRGLDHRHVGDAFRLALRRAGLQGPGRLSLHSLRHGFASLLIANGLDVVFVSRQLGHANPTVTLSTYAHLFARADHAEAARSALEATAHAMRRVGVTGI